MRFYIFSHPVSTLDGVEVLCSLMWLYTCNTFQGAIGKKSHSQVITLVWVRPASTISILVPKYQHQHVSTRDWDLKYHTFISLKQTTNNPFYSGLLHDGACAVFLSLSWPSDGPIRDNTSVREFQMDMKSIPLLASLIFIGWHLANQGQNSATGIIIQFLLISSLVLIHLYAIFPEGTMSPSTCIHTYIIRVNDRD